MPSKLWSRVTHVSVHGNLVGSDKRVVACFAYTLAEQLGDVNSAQEFIDRLVDGLKVFGEFTAEFANLDGPQAGLLLLITPIQVKVH